MSLQPLLISHYHCLFLKFLSLFAVFYKKAKVYIFDFITHFYNTFIDMKVVLIHYLRSEMVITVLLKNLSNNSKY